MAHNPEVGGSNPPPLLQKTLSESLSVLRRKGLIILGSSFAANADPSQESAGQVITSVGRTSTTLSSRDCLLVAWDVPPTPMLIKALRCRRVALTSDAEAIPQTCSNKGAGQFSNEPVRRGQPRAELDIRGSARASSRHARRQTSTVKATKAKLRRAVTKVEMMIMAPPSRPNRPSYNSG